MFGKESAVFKTPRNADARDARIFCSFYIDFGIADVHAVFFFRSDFFNNFKHRIGGRLRFDTVSRSDGGIEEVRKIRFGENPHGFIRLIRNDGGFYAGRTQRCEQFGNAVVGFCRIGAVSFITGVKIFEYFIEKGIRRTFGHCAPNQFYRTVSDKAPHFFARPLRETVRFESVVYA